MRKVSFGKENDHPIPQKNSDDFNDIDELDFIYYFFKIII